MAKCIMNKSDGYIERVSDEHAHSDVKTGDFKYVPKSEWKKQRQTFEEVKSKRK